MAGIRPRPAASGRLRRAQFEANRAKLDATRAKYRGQGVKVTPRFLAAAPDEALIQAAEETRAGLLVLGAHQSRDAERTRLGRVEDLSNDLLERHGKPGVDLVFTRVENAAARGIRMMLESGDYDLVALGSHGYRGVRSWVLGSVARATGRWAPCSVLIVRPPVGDGY